MMRNYQLNLTTLSLALMVSLSSFAQSIKPPGFHELQIGDQAPDFKLMGIDDEYWTLSNFEETKILVVYFTSNHCPVCHAHDPRLVTLTKELKAKGMDKHVAIVAINPNSGDGLRVDELGYSKYDDSFEDMKPYAKDEGFTFPYLYDGDTQKTAKAYGCLATPHVFIFDADRRLQYKGRFDNSRYPDPSTVKTQDARNALMEMLADKPVSTPVTKPFGCSTKWREKIGNVKKDNENWEKADVTLEEIDAKGLAKLVKNDTKKYRLFNVWSTSCAPCLEEFPGLISVSRRMGLRNFELITLSTDLPSDRKKALAFLDKQRAALPKRLAPSLKEEGRKSNNYLYIGADMDELVEALDPKWEGPQPHTVLVAPGGEIVFRHNGKIEERKLLDLVLAEMSTHYQPEPPKYENWARFRGPNGQGISRERGLPTEWSSEQNVAWKTAIPGEAWSSPIVYGDSVFLTTATEDSKSCRIIRINRKTGEIDWNEEVHRQVPGDRRRQNSYATPTPVTDGKYVYAVFSDGAIIAVDYEGNRIWKNTDVSFHSLHGLGASPLLVGDQLVMPFDGSSRDDQKVGWKEPWDQALVLSVDTATGDTRWKGSRGESRVGHVTPILIEEAQQVVSAGGDRVQGFDVKTGERIWSIYSQGEGVTPSPVLGDGLIYTSSGFEAPTIRAIRLGGKGDITDTHIAWEQKRGVPALVSFLYVRPHLYTVTRDNIMHCLDASTGDIVWQRRLKGNFSASPVLADGKMYFTSQEGVTLVLRPGAKYDEIARNELDEECLASFAVSHGHFYVRTADNLLSIGPKE